jgi:5'-methylthioadenosine phosphorylase
MEYGVIGGSGFYRWKALGKTREHTVYTRWGPVTLFSASAAGNGVHFIPRHGPHHSIPPHLVPYRAYLWALKEVGVERILATSAVGSMNPDFKPGDLVLLSDFLDFTKGRPSTFAEKNYVIHIDMTDPYCPQLRGVARETAKKQGIRLHPEGVYVCTEGARFETPSEIRAFRRLGGDVVGMTGVPEVVLARELGLCYAAIALVTNLAAGISPLPLSPSEVNEVFARGIVALRRLLLGIIQDCPPERSCGCGEAPERGRIGK